jgi:Xaa-Pro aminopeptidase
MKALRLNPTLANDLCRERQWRLRRALTDNNLDAALITDRRHVYYFTGYWRPAAFSAAVLIPRDGPTTLAAPLELKESFAADDVLVYESNRVCTLVDDQLGGAISVLHDRLREFDRVGVDGALPASLLHRPSSTWDDLQDVLWTMRRRKDADEIAVLEHAIRATEAAYQAAYEALRPGITEIELCAEIQRAATVAAGEIVGEFGNDFQIGDIGSRPRDRAAQAGEMAILDLSVVYRGYRSDMCRSYVVGRQPSADQLDAYRKIMPVFELIRSEAKPGVSCRAIDRAVRDALDGYRGWKFFHHLGHGTGLSPHEAPRLNPEYDDVFQIGDVFTVEPGLYGPELKAGMRIEEIYVVTDNGLRQLTRCPTSLA